MTLPDTTATRTAILGALRSSAPAAPLPEPDLLPYLQGPYGHGSLGPRLDAASLGPAFEAAARGWRAEVLHAGPGDWAAAVRAALDARGCRCVAIGTAGPVPQGVEAALAGLEVCRFEQPLEHWKGKLFDGVDAGVTGTEAGIADTGSLVLCPGPGEPRSLSLVPPVHVAVLMLSRLYASLPAAMHALAPAADMPTNLLLVSGPSKTADIQQTLAYGAHGPKEVVIVLVDDLSGTGGTQP